MLPRAANMSRSETLPTESGEGERVNYSDSRLKCSALSFRHAFACHLPPQGGLAYSVKLSFIDDEVKLFASVKVKLLRCEAYYSKSKACHKASKIKKEKKKNGKSRIYIPWMLKELS